MSHTGEVKAGRMRRAGVFTALVVAAATLAGCSSAGESDADMYESGGAAYDEADSEAFAPEMEADGDARAASQDRDLIVTGTLYITVEDPIAAADEAADVVHAAGGRIDARSETAADEYDGGSAYLTLRIPTDDLDPVVDELRTLGTVDEYATDSRDVTTEVADLDARISTLRASIERIQALMVDVEKISDIIELEDELASRQAELESLEAQQRGLADQVSMSTIDLSLTTEPVVIQDDDPTSFWDGLQAGWNGLVTFFSAILVIAGVLLPWLALTALIVIAVIVAIRARKSRSGRQASHSGQHGPTGPAPASAAPPTPAVPGGNDSTTPPPAQ